MANSYKIGPYDKLPTGTKVRVGQKQGVVLKFREVRSKSSNIVMIIHTIRFTVGTDGKTYQDIECTYDQILVLDTIVTVGGLTLTTGGSS